MDCVLFIVVLLLHVSYTETEDIILAYYVAYSVLTELWEQDRHLIPKHWLSLNDTVSKLIFKVVIKENVLIYLLQMSPFSLIFLKWIKRHIKGSSEEPNLISSGFFSFPPEHTTANSKTGFSPLPRKGNTMKGIERRRKKKTKQKIKRQKQNKLPTV